MADGSGTDMTSGVGSTARALPGSLRDAERDVRIRNGQVLHIRPILPEDAPTLVAFHATLSPQSIYLRFFNFHPVLSAGEVERFTHVDYAERLALVVLDGDRLVAVGRYDRVAGTDEAEVAFLVEDAFQHLGIGTLLADELARAARKQGISRFVADTLAENSAMLDMFHGLGFPVRSHFEEGVVKVSFPIEPVPEYLEALARREASRLTGVAETTSC